MSSANKEWLNQMKLTNQNLSEINNRMISQLENIENENLRLKQALSELDQDNKDKNKSLENSHKILTKLNDEYNNLTKEYNDMESYVIDLEEETKNYKNLLDEITKSHDIHKTLLLKNENLKNKQILSTRKIDELQNSLNKKDLEIKENLKEINDKNSIIEDFQGKFEDLEKLIETKDMLLKTAEFTNIELKSKIKNLEKDNKDLIKRLNEEYLNKKKDFEEIIKQSIEALKIFYLKFENNINNNYNFYLDIQDKQQNYNNSIGVDENFNSNHNFNFDKLEQNESLAYKKISTLKNLNFSKIKQVKNPYNTVVNDEDYETKSIYSKNDRINRSLSPIGKKGNNNSFSKITINNNINSSKEKMNRTRYEKRSRSVIEKKIKIFNLKNLNFLKNDLFDFQDFFSLYENVKDDNSPPLKIIVEQALDNPLNHKLNQKKILRGDLQAFNFYYNFIKSEMFSGLLREWNIASFINEKLNPILKNYFSDNNTENKGPNVNKLIDKILNGINTLKNRLNEEELINKDLMQTIQNLKNEKKKLNSQLDEVEGNLGNLNILFFKNFDQLQEKINREKLSKENLLKEIDTLLSEIKKLKSEHKDLYEKLNELQKKYFSQCGENEELNKELLDLKKRNQQKNELNYNHVTTEENFSFKGNKYDTEDYRQANTLNSQSGKTGDFLDYSQQDKLVSSNINNRELNFLQKENNIIKQELKKFGLDNDNLKYLLSKVEKDNEILRNNNIYKRFDSNLYIRRAVDIYFLSSFILPVNTLDYSNNNNRNSTEYNNFLLHEDELNKKIYLAELENSKLNKNIIELSEKNQVLEYKLEKLTNKLGKFSNRYLSIHNNIRFNIETTQEYLFKKDLIEKNEEVNNKYYNIPTINYSIPNKDEEGGLCCVCKVQYQEVKSFRKSFKTNTYKELKQFYLGLNTDMEKIASKLDTIVVNFTKTSACFENEGNEEKKIKISQVKEILGTFGKMIGVLGNSLRKYQKDLSVQTGNLEKILEFIFRVVYSSMVYKEKFRAKVRDSKNMNSIASKSKYEESIKKSTINPSSYIVKLENYIFSFGKVYYLIDNREVEEIRSFYNEKSFGDIVDFFKEYCEEIVKVYNHFENNEVGDRNNSVILPQDGKREELINAKYNFDYGKEGDNKNENTHDKLYSANHRGRRDNSEKSRTKINAIENINIPSNYNFNYTSRSNKDNNHNNNLIPLYPKSRSQSKTSLGKDEINESFSKSKNQTIIYHENSQRMLEMICLIIKHYICAKDIILNYLIEDIRNNISTTNASDILNSLYCVLEDCLENNNNFENQNREIFSNVTLVKSMFLRMLGIFKNSLLEILD